MTRNETSIVLPKGTSEFAFHEKMQYQLFPLHGTTDVIVSVDDNQPESLILDSQGEIETGKCN